MRAKSVRVLISLFVPFAAGCTTTGAGRGTLHDGVEAPGAATDTDAKVDGTANAR